ncbi:MAG: TVP38/TMEM64 family protein [Syntrophaceae bacterium]|nr:TVP38/TMEM64 family protein [Syntrophaceae bacterium]
MANVLKARWKWFLILCFLAGVTFFIIYQYNSQLWVQFVKLYDLFHHRQQLKGFIRSFGVYSPLAYIFLQVIQVVIAPIPGGAIEFLGGYLFGAQVGFIYSMIGLTLGSLLAFSLARIFEKIAVEKFVSVETRKKFDYLVEHQGAILSFILFLIPGFPKDALCYILGLTPMHFGIFMIISTIGRIPGTLMACLQGGKAFDHQYKTFLILLGISGLIILVFYIYHEEIHTLIKKLKPGGRREG